MARLSNTTIERLKEALPPYASLYNPIDVVGDAPAERFRKTMTGANGVFSVPLCPRGNMPARLPEHLLAHRL